MILVVVAPVLHVSVPLQPVAVKVAVSEPQIPVLLAETTGAVGVFPVVIVIVFDTPLVPQALTHTAL